jgi:hypothetical protein
LLAPFHAMVDAQLAAQASRPARRFRQPRMKVMRPKPPVLGERLHDLVCVVGEANAWPYDRSRGRTGRPTEQDELVHWVAWRPMTGETFEAMCAPQGPLSPSTLFHTRLSEAALVGSRAALYEAFAKFLRPTDIVGAWGYYGLNLYEAALPERIDLRAVIQRVVNKKLGGIEPFAASLGAPMSPLGAGRGGARLAALAQIVSHYSST